MCSIDKWVDKWNNSRIEGAGDGGIDIVYWTTSYHSENTYERRKDMVRNMQGRFR